MEAKKLNIELSENLDLNALDDSFLENPPPYNLVASDEHESAANSKQSKDFQINDLKLDLIALKLKISLHEGKENVYKEKLKLKDDIIESLKLALDSVKNNANNDCTDLTNAKIDELWKMVNELEKKSLKCKDEEIKRLKAQTEYKDKKITSLNAALVRKDELINSYDRYRQAVMRIQNTIYIKVEYGGSALSMHVPQLAPFEPVLDNQTAGPGWIVIQRRCDGLTDFKRPLKDYYDGFGTNKEDFWLGLEKLHRITEHQQHELYIHIVDYDGKTHYAKYDKFVVGSMEEKYILKSLGRYTGNANDMMRLSENRIFDIGTTRYKNGWWWLNQATPTCNLNGKCSKVLVKNEEYMFWGLKAWKNQGNFIKSVQMMIRPITKAEKKA